MSVARTATPLDEARTNQSARHKSNLIPYRGQRPRRPPSPRRRPGAPTTDRKEEPCTGKALPRT